MSAFKRWDASLDVAVCERCAAMDRQVVPWDRSFAGPAGTSIDAPPLHPNCRCLIEPAPAPVTHVSSRHLVRNLGPKTPVKRENSVLDPSVDDAADLAAMRAGEAIGGRTANGDLTLTVHGRTYVWEESGVVFPIAGDGVYPLNRASFKTLLILIEFGDDDRPGTRLYYHLRAGHTPAADVNEARRVWVAIGSPHRPRPKS